MIDTNSCMRSTIIEPKMMKSMPMIRAIMKEENRHTGSSFHGM